MYVDKYYLLNMSISTDQGLTRFPSQSRLGGRLRGMNSPEGGRQERR